MSAEAHRRGAGPRKWSDQQGFYVYRNRRLLVAGSWLRLGFVKEEHNKLARIQLDFPNELDFAWDINVRKSRAVPPDALREDLIRIAKKTRDVARTIYRHRGATIARQHTEQVFMWEKKVKHNKVFYRHQRLHPAVAFADWRRPGSTASARRSRNFLRLIEETIPVPLILIDGSENPEKLGDQSQKKAPPEMHEVFRALHAALCEDGQIAEGGLRAAGGDGTVSSLPGIARGLQGTRADRRLIMAETDDLKNAVNHALLILKNKPAPTTADVRDAADARRRDDGRDERHDGPRGPCPQHRGVGQRPCRRGERPRQQGG